MWQVAGQPQELELEREREWVERGPALARGQLLEQLEEARQRLERARVRLLFREQAQHRLRADEPDTEAVALLARSMVGVEQLDAGDGLQLPRALVQHQLDVRERLETRAEPRLRLPDPFRDRADASAGKRVEMKHAVGLPETERAQDDRLRLVRASGHGLASLVRTVEGTFAAVSSFQL